MRGKKCFCSMKRPGVFLLPQDGMLVHHTGLSSSIVVPLVFVGAVSGVVYISSFSVVAFSWCR